MPKRNDITQFRKLLRQFISKKNEGKLNGQSAKVEQNLKDYADDYGIDYEQEFGRIESSMNGGKQSKTMARKNPVEVPFTITLKEIDKLHRIRSVKKLNSYVGYKHPCYTARHSGVKPNAHISFQYDPDYHNKVYTLHLLLDGKLEYTACAKGSGKTFKNAWREILSKYGNLEIEIAKQDHAKKVLGAKEYARQEKEYAKKQKSDKDCEDDSTASKSKKKSATKSKKPAPKKSGSSSKRSGQKRYDKRAKASSELINMIADEFATMMMYGDPVVKSTAKEASTKRELWDLYWNAHDRNGWQDDAEFKKLTKDLKDHHMDTAISKAHKKALKEAKAAPKVTEVQYKPKTKESKSSGRIDVDAAKQQQAELKEMFQKIMGA
jgi:hypothetical protein